MLNIQISGSSIQLLKEFPDNGDQFNLLIEGVEITIWDRPEMRDALLPVIPIHPDYQCHTKGGTLTNYAAAQYFKSLRLKGTDPDAAWLAAKGYEDDLANLSKLDETPYEVVQCPDDCPCHSLVPGIDYDTGDPEEPLESSNDDPRASGFCIDDFPNIPRTEPPRVTYPGLTEEEWDRRERGYLTRETHD